MKVKNNYQPKHKKESKVKIMPTSLQRINPEVELFISAILSAKSQTIQNRTTLYDHYEWTLSVDNVVKSLISKRINAASSKKYHLYVDDDLFLEDFFEAPRFKQFLGDIIMSKFWGFHTYELLVNEFRGRKWFDYYLIPNKHINPYSREILYNQFDRQGVPFDNFANILFIGDNDDLGLLLNIVLLSLYRRYGHFAYSNYLDLASENFARIVGTGEEDPADVSYVQQQMKNRGAGGSVHLPPDTQLQLENQSSSSQNQLFENYVKTIKDELAILILGQTMTTEDGSSRSQAEVHQEEQDTVFSADDNTILDVLNYEVIDYLWLWDIPQVEGLNFRKTVTKETELKEKLNNFNLLKDLGVLFTDEEIRKHFEDLLT